MPTHDPKDPLEGKGEEMIPDRGIPFDDIEGYAPKDTITPDMDESPETDSGVIDLPDDSGSPGDRVFTEGLSPDEIESTPDELGDLGELEVHDPGIPEDRDPNAVTVHFDSVSEEFAATTSDLDTGEAVRGAASGRAEAILSTGADPESPNLADEPLFTHEPDFDQPPEDCPDDGMGTIAEEALLADQIPPELMDGGMSAGYPPMRDEDLTPEPDVSMARPEPAAMSGAPLFSPESFGPPGPLSGVAGRAVPVQGAEHPAKPEMLKLLITDEDIKELWARADMAQKGVIEHIATIPLGQKMLNYIQNGKNELLGGKENYEEAERFINEVEYRVSFSKNLKSLSKVFTTGLYLYEIVWAIVLLLFLILGIGVSAAFASAKMEGTPDQTYLLTSMVWGGFGGVIGALLALIKHIAIEQDFDKQHTWWYFSSPTMGIGMGAVVYLFLHVGLFSIVGADADIASPLVIYVFAWLAGYQQNIFTDLVKRMMKTLMGEDLKAEVDMETKPNFVADAEDKTR
jgi:hypothetical protein